MITASLAAFGAFEDQIVDFHPGVACMAAAGGFDLVDDDFRPFDQRAGRKQLESETDRIAIDARKPADAQFNAADLPALARPLDLPPNLLDQCFDN